MAGWLILEWVLDRMGYYRILYSNNETMFSVLSAPRRVDLS
jgi:hypothetical protein